MRSLPLLLSLSAAVRAQQTPAAPDTAPPEQPTYVLRTATNLVVEDVTVTGADGKPIHGLQAQDFALTEDGHTQRIRNFAEHNAAVSSQSSASAPSKLPPGIFTNNVRARAAESSESPALNVLLLDMLNTPLRDQQYAREQIKSFLDHAPAGTQIAIFGLSSRLTMLQGFTSDFTLLRGALGRKAAGSTSGLLDNPLGGGATINPNGISEALADTVNTPDTQELLANAQQFEADVQSFQLGQRTVLTLEALQTVARYLANVNGRKNLIWFSGSFPVDLLPNASTQNGFSSMASYEGEFRETVNLLARGQVALYPVDARGPWK